MTRVGGWFGRILVAALYAAVAAFFVLPLWWAVVGSLTPLKDVFRHLAPFDVRALWPSHVTFSAYAALFRDHAFGRVLFNTAFVALATVAAGLVVNGLAGFAFAVMEFRGKRLLFAATLISSMVPAEALAIPLYRVVGGLGLLDSYGALIAPAISNGIAIFLFRQFFAEVPIEITEAARIDGAGWLTILVRLYVPLSLPVTIAAALLLFVFQWESFLWPLIAVHSPDFTVIQIALANLQQQHSTQWTQIFAASSLAALVPLLLLLPLQRYYVQGIVNSGVKG
ncbi:MAG: carbohydrate ABC transporter permease [Deinococcales bacterium]